MAGYTLCILRNSVKSNFLSELKSSDLRAVSRLPRQRTVSGWGQLQLLDGIRRTGQGALVQLLDKNPEFILVNVPVFVFVEDKEANCRE